MLALKSTLDTERAARIEAEQSSLLAENLLLAETERRIAAESRADSAAQYVQQLHADIQTMQQAHNTQLNSIRESHSAQIATMLTHLAPLKTEPPLSLKDPLTNEMSSAEIAAIPASTSRERALRDRRVKEAREREQSEEERKRRKDRMDLLVTEEEQKLHRLDFDPSLGILTEKVEVATPESAEAN